MFFYCYVAAAVGLVAGLILGYFLLTRFPDGTILMRKDGWRLIINDPLEKLEKRKRIIFNVSKDKEVVTDENRA